VQKVWLVGRLRLGVSLRIVQEVRSQLIRGAPYSMTGQGDETEMTVGLKKLYNGKFHNVYSSPDTIKIMPMR
jgi:hypothetical protein